MAHTGNHRTRNHAALGTRIQDRARQLGFDLAGLVPAPPAEPTADMARYRAWLDRGYHGEMAYLARPDAVARRANPAHILPGVQSIVVVAQNYHTIPLPPALRDDPSRGIIASYAWGDDYHDQMLPRLHQLAAWIDRERGQPVATRAYVDTGPLLERALAVKAGMGFVGKNTNLIHPRLGSWLLLGELLLAVDVAAAAGPGASSLGRESRGTCGRCIRCLEACPTGALVAPYLLDARRCISYLTIELKGPIPRALRPLLGNRIFGCDICQEVCPWNRRLTRPAAAAGPAKAPQPAPDDIAPPLVGLLGLDEEGFQRRFAGSPVKRARRRGLLRNVAVALGNWGAPAAVPALIRALDDVEPLVRQHVAWALGRIGTIEARRALQEALVNEQDGAVCQEITAALSMSP